MGDPTSMASAHQSIVCRNHRQQPAERGSASVIGHQPGASSAYAWWSITIAEASSRQPTLRCSSPGQRGDAYASGLPQVPHDVHVEPVSGAT